MLRGSWRNVIIRVVFTIGTRWNGGNAILIISLWHTRLSRPTRRVDIDLPTRRRISIPIWQRKGEMNCWKNMLKESSNQLFVSSWEYQKNWLNKSHVCNLFYYTCTCHDNNFYYTIFSNKIRQFHWHDVLSTSTLYSRCLYLWWKMPIVKHKQGLVFPFLCLVFKRKSRSKNNPPRSLKQSCAPNSDPPTCHGH